ncbi:hypothetical protein PR048_003758 [Dryococelus australis]|uniref:Uncharacterized protein n=1 Tax=Dryococelus australis TaxID=614101 RepID=A0ABQ9INX0_9NEOP|nr:hypothetical protein PR048_003758 [Dryococelus australis]
MNTSPQANQGENVAIAKSDWFNFEQKFISAVQELKLKRTLLTEVRQEVQQTLMQNHEKDALLDQERHKANELQINLSMMTQTVRKWEEERKALADAATRNKASLDIAVAENDLLKDKVHDLQVGLQINMGRLRLEIS